MAKIITYPNKGLNEKCIDCTIGEKSLIKLAKAMTKQMYDNTGCGIAAPQVGDNRRLCIIDTEYDVDDKTTREPIIMVNPEIIELSGEIGRAHV